MTIEQLYKYCNEFFGLDIKVKSRANNLPLYRKYYCLLAKMYTTMYNYTQIGNIIKVDHSSVTSCITTLNTFLEVDKKVVRQFEELEEFVLSKHPELRKKQSKYTPKRDYKNLRYLIIIEKQRIELKKRSERI
ncbi:MAG: hypothetical protein ACPGDB_03505, partial [Fusobacterium sp.]